MCRKVEDAQLKRSFAVVSELLLQPPQHVDIEPATALRATFAKFTAHRPVSCESAQRLTRRSAPKTEPRVEALRCATLYSTVSDAPCTVNERGLDCTPIMSGSPASDSTRPGS